MVIIDRYLMHWDFVTITEIKRRYHYILELEVLIFLCFLFLCEFDFLFVKSRSINAINAFD